MFLRSHSRTLAVLALIGLLAAGAPLSSVALPTPGLFCEEARVATGRLFPEAEQTNDFVGFEEVECGFQVLEKEHPERIEVLTVAESFGWKNDVAGGHDRFPVYVVEVTNEESIVPFAAKQKLVFQLSIHGNEKGGREGGVRVIEDLVRGIGMAETNPELLDRLDYQVFVFVFPNPDGWRHEELAYRQNDAGYVSTNGVETQNFVRTNGNGVDMNRDWPTVGWQNEGYTAMSEPEVIGIVEYLRNLTNVARATDIHGMLHPADGEVFDVAAGKVEPETWSGHFVLTMLPAGRQSPEEMVQTTSLAELIKQRLNNDPFFAEWQNLPSTAGAWGGEFNDWGTVWDTIGYTDSGFTSDWYAQDIGLNAPGVDFELAYNHITFDNYYPGPVARINSYHVESVRHIVRAFSDHASTDFALAVETTNLRTGYLYNSAVVSNKDVNLTGWPKDNPADDMYDVGHRSFTARPNDYFADIARVAVNQGSLGVIEGVNAAEIDAGRLARYDNFIISGDSWLSLKDNAAGLAAVRAWVEAGGNLVLTDSGLQYLESLGIAKEGAVKNETVYAPATNFVVSRDHELVQGVRGLARQLYEPVPLGFNIRGGGSSPSWFVDAAGYTGEVVGVSGARPQHGKVNFGQATVGDGRVVFLGALLPTPSTEHNTPYGVDAYATTYTGNQLLLNALGFRQGHEETALTVVNFAEGNATPDDVEPAAEDVPAAIPGFAGVAAVGIIGAVAVALRRRT